MFHNIANLNKRLKADVIVIPYWQDENDRCKLAVKKSDITSDLDEVLKQANIVHFDGILNQTVLVHYKTKKERSICLLGLGEEGSLTPDKLLNTVSACVKQLIKSKFKEVNFLLPTISKLSCMSGEDFVRVVVDGVCSINYASPKYGRKGSIKGEGNLLSKVSFVGVVSSITKTIFDRAHKVYEGVYLARDLINSNADDITPDKLAKVSQKLASTLPNMKVKILNKQAIAKSNMGLLMAVSQGSHIDPCFIVLDYIGSPKSKDKTVLIGKGVTYDTGGLDLKPGKSMLTMKEDMSGAATVLGVISAVASLKLPINVTAVVPATENAISSSAYKMGDVYVGMSGLSVEIGSTDAEGRLILADAITYSLKHLNPSRIIDVATLTGAMVVSLGEDVAGYFCNNKDFSEAFYQASQESLEPMWELPLVDSYDKHLDSEIADMRNIGANRAGSITAALFLRKFVEKDIPWIHLDIAGTAFREKNSGPYPIHASGFGVRTIVSYLENIINK